MLIDVEDDEIIETAPRPAYQITLPKPPPPRHELATADSDTVFFDNIEFQEPEVAQPENQQVESVPEQRSSKTISEDQDLDDADLEFNDPTTEQFPAPPAAAE